MIKFLDAEVDLIDRTYRSLTEIYNAYENNKTMSSISKLVKIYWFAAGALANSNDIENERDMKKLPGHIRDIIFDAFHRKSDIDNDLQKNLKVLKLLLHEKYKQASRDTKKEVFNILKEIHYGVGLMSFKDSKMSIMTSQGRSYGPFTEDRFKEFMAYHRLQAKDCQILPYYKVI